MRKSNVPVVWPHAEPRKISNNLRSSPKTRPKPSPAGHYYREQCARPAPFDLSMGRTDESPVPHHCRVDADTCPPGDIKNGFAVSAQRSTIAPKAPILTPIRDQIVRFDI